MDRRNGSSCRRTDAIEESRDGWGPLPLGADEGARLSDLRCSLHEARTPAHAGTRPHLDSRRRGDMPELRTRRDRSRCRRPLGPSPFARRYRTGRPADRQRRPSGTVPPANLQERAHPSPRLHRRHRTPPWTLRLGHADGQLRSGRQNRPRSSRSRGDGRRHLHLLLPARRIDRRRLPPRQRRIYEKFNHPDEWTLDYQGSIVAYSPSELVLRPDSPNTLQPNTAIAWSPSVGSTRSEDTVVIDQRGYEVVTEAQVWPKIEVVVKGFPISRPGILER